MIIPRLDPDAKESLQRQIVRQISGLIDREAVREGERLPSTRELAERLGVNRTTVVLAYQELWALGYLETSPGAAARVRKRLQLATPDTKSSRSLIDWGRVITPQAREIYCDCLRFQRGRWFSFAAEPRPRPVLGLISFFSPSLDEDVLPIDQFRSCLADVMHRDGPALLRYGEGLGYQPLREWLAHRLRNHAISADTDEIMITSGSQQALDLVLRILVAPGRTVIVESPTYGLLLPLLRFHRARTVGIPMKPDGMDLTLLERALRVEKPALVYSIPNFHYPTGITTSQRHRERLLALCARHRVPIVEDGFEEEMKYFGKVALPVKSMDRDNVVIYLGSFSKVLFQGLRVAWVVADRRLIVRLAAAKLFSDLTSPPPLQAAVHEFCRRGFYDRHIKRMHRLYRRRMMVALRSLRKHMPRDRVEWIEPSGGFLIWLCFRGLHRDLDDQLDVLLRHRVMISTGKYMFLHPAARQYARLSISALDEPEIEEGIRRLAGAVRDLYR